MFLGAFCCLLCILIWNKEAKAHFPVIYSWSSVEYLYENLDKRETDIATGQFNPFNVIILDSDYYEGIYYVTTPSLLPGTPATLSIITKELDSNGGFLLKPFPDWSWQNRSTCEGIISAFRIKIDQLGRMWIIDSGTVNAFTESGTTICPPKLLAIDLNRDNSLIVKYEFPKEQITDDSTLLDLEVQILDKDGLDTVVYVADPTGFRMLVYHLKRKTSYYKEHSYFKSDPTYEEYNINGVQFKLDDGLFRITVDNSKDILYFHSLTSGNEYSVKADILRKPNDLTEEDNNQFNKFSYKKKRHTSSEVITKDGVLIFATLENNALYAWNTKSKFIPSNFKLIAKNSTTLQFVSGMKLIGNQVIVTTSRLQNILANGQNERGVVNFRILQGKIGKLS